MTDYIVTTGLTQSLSFGPNRLIQSLGRPSFNTRNDYISCVSIVQSWLKVLMLSYLRESSTDSWSRDYNSRSTISQVTKGRGIDRVRTLTTQSCDISISLILGIYIRLKQLRERINQSLFVFPVSYFQDYFSHSVSTQSDCIVDTKTIQSLYQN